MFRSKTAEDSFSDPNLGAGALEYIEVRAKTEPSDHFQAAAPMQFDFNVGQGRYALLNESYFEVKYKVGRIKHGTTSVVPLANDDFQSTPNVDDDGTAISTANLADYSGDGNPQTADNSKIDISLQPRFLNHCISDMRHMINGVQCASQNDPAPAQTFKDTQMTSTYDEKAASAFMAQLSVMSRRNQCSNSIDQTVCYSPPMGLWDVADAITGCAHQVNINFLPQSAYNQAVWDFPIGSGKQSSDFTHLIHSGDLSANATRCKYCFNIESVVLRLAVISPRDRLIPQPSVLLECRDINCVRVDAGNQSSITKTVTIPGSTYKQAIMFAGDANQHESNMAQPLYSEITELLNLQWSVAGQQLQLPQYELSGEAPVRPYADYLACNASLYSDRGVGNKNSLNEWAEYPIYMARVVQEATGAQKECVVRAQSANTDSKTFTLGSYSMSRVILFYNESGEVANVQINM